MEGEWIDVTGAFGTKGAVVATYKVTGSGAKTSHMHNARYEFVSADEVKADWQN